MRIAVFGAGAWGTALAIHAARRHSVTLWTRDPAHAQAMLAQRANERYLPGAALPPAIDATADLDRACDWLGEGPDALAVLATSVAGMRPVLGALSGRLRPGSAGLVWLCKGIERDTGALPHMIAAEALPGHGHAVLSGPSFAQEVAAGLPVALTVASRVDFLRRAVQQALHHGAARIYGSDDVVGVELGGALKNVMAIAAGACDGLKLGHNARAALITRGLAETARLGVALGARASTFTGLTGLGDLVLTCTGDLSRNRRVGLALAEGRPLQDIVTQLGHVAEGVPCAAAALMLAERHRVELPIVAAVQAVLDGRRTPADAVRELLSREPRDEDENA
ncbi:NAD(P)-dependent glycerol-3-phosphate dehydrogenase [Burkholderiaceae bacterium FT117]|uniref:NAD(P)H-dependent glycerol-3-phosphate dehydrogenase n=1 Tax=Zeimonas sediminis TaxID=2944268 RepID=UPI002343084F|nr:NAD(P)H-dependent glycerol-3-phosphate dehydrogenase [Zeimonas sediminis]MCM5571687.1 NAD(P)-dependent glycerol-3-phosphate dehydrogenase [Zeimonas sediminis]